MKLLYDTFEYGVLMRADDTFDLAKELIIIHQRSSINDTRFPHQVASSSCRSGHLALTGPSQK